MTGSGAAERALVIGAGVSGLALARFLAARGARVRLADLRPRERLAGLERLPPGVELRLGGYGEDDLAGCDAVYASPGVPWDGEPLAAARRRGIPVSSEIDLFLRLCPAPVIGVTGTNGKTTTTTLVGHVVGQGERPVMVGGNIGETVLDRLDQVTPRHWVVLELSSFQLESSREPRPHIGVVLNLTPDHLDRHHTMAAYVEAKTRMVAFQGEDDWAVLNGRDPIVRAMAGRTRARVTWFDEHRPDPPMPIPGEHNLMNARAAAAVGRIAGLSDQQIAAAIAAFPGVEHRIELVGEWGGVRWYNDSKATNPDAGRVAVASFPGRPVVLIAGGRGTGFELAGWLAEVRARTSAVVLIGESAELLEPELAGHPCQRAAGLEDAVARAERLARPGGVVLFSPAYKSFDMFENFEDRGRRFKQAVLEAHR